MDDLVVIRGPAAFTNNGAVYPVREQLETPRPDEHAVALDQLELAKAVLADFGLDWRTLPAPFEDEFETDRGADAQDVAHAGTQRGVAASNALDLDVMRTHVGYRFLFLGLGVLGCLHLDVADPGASSQGRSE
jgi:hypothetical protein